MKRLLYIISLMVITSACTDVIDLHPQDELTPQSYWKNANDLKLFINQFYPSIGENQNIAYYSLDINSDNAQSYSPSDILNGTRIVPSTGGGWNWGNIRSINIFLQHGPNITQGSEDEINQYLGEGYWFRAYFYFQKLKQFGGVPIYKKPLTLDSKGLSAPRDPRSDVANFIIDDLNKAIPLLHEKDQIPAHRINKAAALALKSRVCLYEGTWEKYHFNTPFGVKGAHGAKFLKMAVKASETIMKSNNFKIYSTSHPEKDYYNLFNQQDLSENSEAILSIATDPSVDLGNETWNYLNGGRSSGSGMTRQLMQSYLCTDGLPISISPLYQGDITIKQVVKNRDPRLEQSIWVPGTVRFNFSNKPDVTFKHPRLIGGDATTTGYMIRKGSSQDPSQNSGSSGSNLAGQDGFVFRYAEILLNYAESKAELGTITQADLDKSINLLRARVGIQKMTYPVGFEDPNWNFPNLSPIINEIRRERRVELAFEGFRFDDLMRWAAGELIQGMKLKGAKLIIGQSFPNIQSQQELKALPVDKNNYIWFYKNSAPNGFEFDESRDYLSPLPLRELTLNPNLKQNPGWK